MAGVLDLMGYVQKQGEMGRARGQETALGRLAGQAYGAAPDQRNQILSGMAQIDPRAAQAQSQQFKTGDSDRVAQLSQKAKLFVGMAKAGNQQAVAGMYPQIAKEARELFGTEVPDTYDPSFLAGIEQFANIGMDDASTPAGVREFNGLTQGLSPDDVMAARRVKLGLDGRASSAGYSQVKFTGSDGRERIGVLNGQTGQIDMPDGTSFNPQTGQTAPTQQAAPAPQSGPSAGLPQVPGGPPVDVASVRNDYLRVASRHGLRITSMDRSEAENAALPGAANNSQHKSKTAVDYSTQGLSPEKIAEVEREMKGMGYEGGYTNRGTAPHMHFELPPRGRSVGAGLGAGRTPEEQAALTTAAQEGTKTQFLAQQEGIKADAAVDQAVRIEQGKTAVEKSAAAPAAMATLQQSVASIDALLADPELGSVVGLGSMNPLNKVPGTKARGLIARADQIAGQSFLAAFNQLKGGGAITEREGEAATKAMARLDRSQSLGDYRAALTELKAAIAPAITRLRNQAAGGTAPGRAPAERRARNPQTGQVLVLRNGQWVPE